MEPKDLLGTLGINWQLFLAQLVNFAVVLFVMWKWVYTPLVEMMDVRTKDIQDGLKNAKKAEETLSSSIADKERLLQQARADAHQLMEETREEAETMRKEKLAQTKSEIEKIALEAKQQIRSEREAAYDLVKRDIGELVALATQKVAAGMDEKGQRQLIDRAVKELDNT